MSTAATSASFLELARQAGLIDEQRLDACLKNLGDTAASASPHELADVLIQAGLLTSYQAVQLLKGKADCFQIGPYRILERLGFGAMSNVYLCEHQANRQRFAVKVLTRAKADDPVALKRFYREARASASMDHPNIVRVHDVDWDDQSHFMVMDFVDGSSVQDIVQHFGAMDAERAAHYVRQAALGLQHAHEHGLVHRDIKPGNLLIDRQGTTKILDMGLARFSKEEEGPLTKGGEVLGSPEYLAPEQGRDSHNVDIRADIYSLGAILYFMLAGRAPYSEEKTLAGKLTAKESRPPEPLRTFRPDLPEELTAVIDTMLAKMPAYRYQTPAEVVEALAPWTKAPIDPPPAEEMPQLSPAAVIAQPKPVKPAPKQPSREERRPSEPAPATIRVKKGAVRDKMAKDSALHTGAVKRSSILAAPPSEAAGEREESAADVAPPPSSGRWLSVLVILAVVAVLVAWVVVLAK